MDGDPFYVNFGINGNHYTKALVDSGCLCFSTISLSLANHLRLPRISITPRDLAQVNVTVKGAIREVAYADTDIDGHKLNRVFFYVIPDQEDDVILGRPWMDAEEVTISPSRGELTIGTSGLIVKERSQGESPTLPIELYRQTVI
jgi:predicted aspartyl protease